MFRVSSNSFMTRKQRTQISMGIMMLFVATILSGCGFDSPWWPWGGGWWSPPPDEEPDGAADTAFATEAAVSTDSAEEDMDAGMGQDDKDDGSDDVDGTGSADYGTDDGWDTGGDWYVPSDTGGYGPETCDNLYDDDYDGRYDCQDEECVDDPACPVTPGHCSDPLIIETLGGTVDGTFVDAINTSRSGCGGHIGVDNAYRFEVQEAGTVEFRLTGVSPVLYLQQACENDYYSYIACANSGWGEMQIVDDGLYNEWMSWYGNGQVSNWDTDPMDSETDLDTDGVYINVATDTAVNWDTDTGPDGGGARTAILYGRVTPGIYYLFVDSEDDNRGTEYTLEHMIRPNPCDANPCLAVEECVPSFDWSSYECVCLQGTLRYEDTCVDDPCVPNPCEDPSRSVCEPQLPADFTCHCTPGYAEDTLTGECVPIPGETCAAPLSLESGEGVMPITLEADGLDVSSGNCGGWGSVDKVIAFTMDEAGVVAFELTGNFPVLTLRTECDSESYSDEIACANLWWTDLEDYDDEYNPTDPDEWDTGSEYPDYGTDTAFPTDVEIPTDTEISTTPDADHDSDSGWDTDSDDDYFANATASLWAYLEAGTYYLWVDSEDRLNEDSEYELKYEFRDNPCDDNNCSGVSVCEPLRDWTGYTCECPEDMLPFEEGCVDNPCDPNPCDAAHMNVCTPDLPSDVVCSCNPGAQPNADGSACEAIPGDSCEAPIILEIGEGTVSGDTFNNSDLYISACGGRGAPEAVYQFELTEPMHVEFWMAGYDTVTYVRTVCDSQASEVGCNDQSYNYYYGDTDVDYYYGGTDTAPYYYPTDTASSYPDVSTDTEYETAFPTDTSVYIPSGTDTEIVTDPYPTDTASWENIDTGEGTDGGWDYNESRLYLDLEPGVYFLFADGWHTAGAYELHYSFTAQ